MKIEDARKAQDAAAERLAKAVERQYIRLTTATLDAYLPWKRAGRAATAEDAQTLFETIKRILAEEKPARDAAHAAFKEASATLAELIAGNN